MEDALLVLVGVVLGILVCAGCFAFLKRRAPHPPKRSPAPLPVSPPQLPTDNLAFLHPAPQVKSVRDYALWQTLTKRETETAAHVARGLSNAEVAALLRISPRTVDAYLRSVYSKLDVHSRTELANFVRDLTD